MKRIRCNACFKKFSPEIRQRNSEQQDNLEWLQLECCASCNHPMTKKDLINLCDELLIITNTLAYSKPGELGYDVMLELGQEVVARYCDDGEFNLNRVRFDTTS